MSCSFESFRVILIFVDLDHVLVVFTYIIAVQIMSSSWFSSCCGGCSFQVFLYSLSICDLPRNIVCFPGQSIILCGLSRGSVTFGYEVLASLSCMEKHEKLRTLRFISNRVPLRCKKKSPIKWLANLAMIMKRSTNVISPTSNCNSVVAIGVSNCPLATMI